MRSLTASALGPGRAEMVTVNHAGFSSETFVSVLCLWPRAWWTMVGVVQTVVCESVFNTLQSFMVQQSKDKLACRIREAEPDANRLSQVAVNRFIA